MSENTSTDTWQVDVNGQIYDTGFDEMTQWIAEGSLLRGDKVRKGSLRWIEAGRVPTLTNFFNAKDSGNPIYPVVSTTIEAPSEPQMQAPAQNFSPVVSPQSHVESRLYEHAAAPDHTPVQPIDLHPVQNLAAPQPPVKMPANGMCFVHTDVPAVYACETCGSALCKACPNSYGGSVKICPFCGAMCKSLDAVAKVQQEDEKFDAALREGFGLTDFGRALVYPFRFIGGLIFGAILFALFTYGQSGSSIGGPMMIAASIFCMMGSNMLTFGILANTVENFSQGKIGSSFMPQFDGFSIWEDVIEPFFLSIAAYVVSFGLIAVLVAGAVWYLVSSAPGSVPGLDSASINTVMPGGQIDLNAAKQVPQIGKVREQLNKTDPWKKDGAMPTQDEIANGQNPAAGHDTEEDVKIAQKLVAQREQARAAILPGQTTLSQQKVDAPGEAQSEQSPAGMSMDDISGSLSAMSGQISTKSALLIIPFVLAILWGLFYFPAACAVAGYTRSISATLNPSVGLDTIKHLGFGYVKILFFGLVIVVVSAILSGIIHSALSAYDLPGFGNLPAKIVGSFVTFYFSIVFSCTLGFALYKKSDKLKLLR